jgi:hypothetical protein
VRRGKVMDRRPAGRRIGGRRGRERPARKLWGAPLGREAIAAARDVDYQGVVVRVVPPEYLNALYLQPQARTARRREPAATGVGVARA